MVQASVFSGEGGPDLAAEWMGWENVFNCEIDPFCRTLLNYYWPRAQSYGDIKTADFTIWRGRVDVLTGGFPCQPFSTAGEGKGDEDERLARALNVTLARARGELGKEPVRRAQVLADAAD